MSVCSVDGVDEGRRGDNLCVCVCVCVCVFVSTAKSNSNINFKNLINMMAMFRSKCYIYYLFLNSKCIFL